MSEINQNSWEANFVENKDEKNKTKRIYIWIINSKNS